MEMEVPPEERVVRGDCGFPVCAVTSRYFWLCAECSRALIIKRWTPAGLILEPHPRRHSRKEHIESFKAPPAEETTQPRRRVSISRVA
jgi:hypothetical protein